MTIKTILNEWEKFSLMTMPADAPAIQVKEMKNAFYAGAFTLLEIMSADIPEADQMKTLEQAYEDITKHFEELTK